MWLNCRLRIVLNFKVHYNTYMQRHQYTQISFRIMWYTVPYCVCVCVCVCVCACLCVCVCVYIYIYIYIYIYAVLCSLHDWRVGCSLWNIQLTCGTLSENEKGLACVSPGLWLGGLASLWFQSILTSCGNGWSGEICPLPLGFTAMSGSHFKRHCPLLG